MKTNSDQTRTDLNSNDLAYYTTIATPEGHKHVEDFNIGDPVLVFSLKLGPGTITLTPSEAKISFSSGNGHQQKSLMMFINLLDYDNSSKKIVCSPDQLFLLINGKYEKAEKLALGQELVNIDGNPVKIVQLNANESQHGVHHIATDAKRSENPNGHLLLSNGVIVGDFTMQMYFDNFPAEMKQ